MKNLWILFGIGVLLFGCSVVSDDSKIEGSWILSEKVSGDSTEVYNTAAGASPMLEFKADRTFTIIAVSNESGKWNIDTTEKIIIFHKNAGTIGNVEISSNKYEFLDYNKLKLIDPSDTRNYSIYIKQ